VGKRVWKRRRGKEGAGELGRVETRVMGRERWKMRPIWRKTYQFSEAVYLSLFKASVCARAWSISRTFFCALPHLLAPAGIDVLLLQLCGQLSRPEVSS
jgi:hypothetical protein